MPRLLLLYCLFATGLAAQQADSLPSYKRFQLGIVYGQMNHQVDFTPNQSVEALRGTDLGVALRYFDKRLIGFQAELFYSTAGWREELDTSFTSLYERKFRFVELQLLTQFSYGKGAVRPLLQAGPYVSFPLSDDEQIPAEYDPGDAATPPIYGFDIPFRPNYGLRIGAGLNVEIGPLTVQLDARFLIGFNDLVKTGTTQVAISRRTGIGGHTGVFFTF